MPIFASTVFLTVFLVTVSVFSNHSPARIKRPLILAVNIPRSIIVMPNIPDPRILLGMNILLEVNLGIYSAWRYLVSYHEDEYNGLDAIS